MLRRLTLALSAAAMTVGVVSTAALATGTATGAAGTASAASVSLSGWKLILPVDSSGGTSGNAAVASPARLYSPWLTQDSSGALNFWAPANGATTPGSLHARTELSGTGTFVLGQGSAGLNETLKVTRLPDSSNQIIIGQMFASSGPFAHLHYQGGKVYGFIHGQSSEYDLMSGVPLGATFSASITASGNTVKFSATYNGQTATQTATGISSWVGQTMHFQAGDYEQDEPGSASTDGGRVSFSALAQYGVPGGSTGGGFPSGYNQLVVQNSGLCVDVAGGSSANSAAIDQWTCKTSGTANQEFQFVPVSGGYGELQNQNSGSDIVVQGASTANGGAVIQYTQNGTSNGLWLPIQQSDGTWQFQNQNSGLCLDQAGAVTTQGVQFDQWTCKTGTGTNQDFAVQ